MSMHPIGTMSIPWTSSSLPSQTWIHIILFLGVTWTVSWAYSRPLQPQILNSFKNVHFCVKLYGRQWVCGPLEVLKPTFKIFFFSPLFLPYRLFFYWQNTHELCPFVNYLAIVISDHVPLQLNIFLADIERSALSGNLTCCYSPTRIFVLKYVNLLTLSYSLINLIKFVIRYFGGH